jgi:hypothetical protein
LGSIFWRGELVKVGHSIQRVPISVPILLLIRPLLRERTESVGVGALQLSAVDNPSTVTTREPINTREESRRERIERSSHGRRGERIRRESRARACQHENHSSGISQSALTAHRSPFWRSRHIEPLSSHEAESQMLCHASQ